MNTSIVNISAYNMLSHENSLYLWYTCAYYTYRHVHVWESFMRAAKHTAIPSGASLASGVSTSMSEPVLDKSELTFESSGMVNTPSQLGALTVPDFLLGPSEALRTSSADLDEGGGVSEAALGRLNPGAPATGCLSPSSSLMEELRLGSISVSLEVL